MVEDAIRQTMSISPEHAPILKEACEHILRMYGRGDLVAEILGKIDRT